MNTPRRCALVALVVLTSACAGRSGVSESPAGHGPNSPTGAASQATEPSRGPTGATATSAPGRTSSAPPTAPALTTSPGQPANGAVGAFSRTMLQPRPATSVAVELLVQSGATPNERAVTAVGTKLRDVTGKPVDVLPAVTFTGGPSSWTASDLKSIVDRDGTPNRVGASRAILHLVVVHGQFGNDPSVLGVAFRGDALAVFPDQASGSLMLDTDRVATSIYLHETGHLLGLVDEVLHDGRGDPNDPSHCMCHSPDRNSVMYYAIDTTAIGQLLGGGPPTDFDAADYGDLAKIRAGA